MKRALASIGALMALAASAEPAKAVPVAYWSEVQARAYAGASASEPDLEDVQIVRQDLLTGDLASAAQVSANNGLSGSQLSSAHASAATSVQFNDASSGSVEFTGLSLAFQNDDFNFLAAGYGSAFVYSFGITGAGTVRVDWQIEYTGLSAEHWLFNSQYTDDILISVQGYPAPVPGSVPVPRHPDAAPNGDGTFSFATSGFGTFAIQGPYEQVLVLQAGNGIRAYPVPEVGGTMNISFQFTITDSGSGNGGGTDVPEPATLALAGLGAASLAARGRIVR